jgi:protocatechuate 3,4-dioxygenase, beta subunit
MAMPASTPPPRPKPASTPPPRPKPAPTPPPRPSHQPPASPGLAVTRYERPSGVHPPLDYPGYRSTALRAPHRPLVLLPHRLTEITGPLLGAERVAAADADLTAQHSEEPQGQRIVVAGRVLDSDGRPVPDTLIEIWQANAGGRYRHAVDNHPAPLDENFTGLGRCLTDSQGRYRFVTIKPGAYPWGNHPNAWRPAHIHFSLFGRAFTQRLVTQMFFPGDPLYFQDPIFNSVPEAARDRLISRFDLGLTVPEWALGFAWDIVLRGHDATVFEQPDGGQ